MKTIGMAAVATALICMGSFSARATVTQVNNIDDPVNHPYSQNAQTSCTSAGDCSIVFSATAAPETLIAHVSCVYFLLTGGITIYALVGNPSTSDVDYLPINAYANGGNGAWHSMNENTYLFFQSGQVPRIDVDSSGEPVQSMACTISGYHK
jgi:hypothetical protein